MITNEDQQEDFEDDSTDIVSGIRYYLSIESLLSSNNREKLKFYEKKILEAESERIEKEKENLELKESLMQLQAQLKAREKEFMRSGYRTKFEVPSAVLLLLLRKI